MNKNSSVCHHAVLGDWARCGEDATRVRHAVFIVEQGVLPEEELDALDPECVHALLYDARGVAIATGRLLPDGHIGRMAVLKAYRGQGAGSAVLKLLMEEASRRGHPEVVLAAQVHAQDFYRLHGFLPEGPIFKDAGIDHVTMRCVLPRHLSL